MKVFLMTSCRVHRPFDCSKVYPGGKHELYDTLHTNYAQSNFVGSLYDTRYTIDLLKALHTRQYSQNIRGSAHEFASTCDASEECDVFIIELASLKYYTLNGVYISHSASHLHENVERHDLTIQELRADIEKIEAIVKQMNKAVLFVSHFNVYNVPARTKIIDALTAYATYMFDPTPVVASDIGACIKDQNHYTSSADILVMEALHLKLQSMALELPIQPIGKYFGLVSEFDTSFSDGQYQKPAYPSERETGWTKTVPKLANTASIHPYTRLDSPSRSGESAPRALIGWSARPARTDAPDNSGRAEIGAGRAVDTLGASAHYPLCDAARPTPYSN